MSTINTHANRPMPKNMRASVGYDDGGTYVEWYRWGRYEDDGETTRWYAGPLECRALVKIAPPRGVAWRGASRGPKENRAWSGTKLTPTTSKRKRPSHVEGRQDTQR